MRFIKQSKEKKRLKKIEYYKKKGITIGDNFRIFDPDNTIIDIQNPKLIKIGNNVMITRGVIILTHDYSWAVLSSVYDRMYGNVGRVSIGNNVFIGMNSIVLKNTCIGDNVIIGAGSIVSGNIESNSVYCGNPAKKIMSLDEYNKKISNRQIEDVVNNMDFIINNKMNIEENDFFEYFYLFRDYSLLNDKELGQIKRIGNTDKIISNYDKYRKYRDFEYMQDELKNK
ncbi:MAG: acyltransferase [Bacilli bacterium]|nr:acyltransferase [Bacilli bacterium]